MIKQHERTLRLGARDQLRKQGLLERLRFEQQTLVHGIGPEQMIEIAGRRTVDWHATRSDGFGEPDFRVLGREQANDAPVTILERGFDGMAPEDAHEAVVDVAARYRRLPAEAGLAGPAGAAFRASPGVSALVSAGALPPRALLPRFAV
jgi:hypothetical protein